MRYMCAWLKERGREEREGERDGRRRECWGGKLEKERAREGGRRERERVLEIEGRSRGGKVNRESARERV